MHFLTVHTPPLLLDGEQNCQNQVGMGLVVLKI